MREGQQVIILACYGNVKGRHNLTILLDNFSTRFRRNSTRKIVTWFEELINLNHLTIFITEFHQKLVEKLSKKKSAIYLALIAIRSECHLTLIMYGVTAKTSVNIKLYALCLQTSGITSDPLKPSNLMNHSVRQHWDLS